MPYASDKQRRFMYAKHPEIAKRYEKEGKSNVEYRKKPAKKAAAAASKAVKQGDFKGKAAEAAKKAVAKRRGKK